jgi:hypothetical protein
MSKFFDGVIHGYQNRWKDKLFDMEWPTEEKLGATGQFPEGKLSRSNEGEIRMAIGWDEINKVVRVEFGTPITWFGLSQEEAVAMAHLLLRHVGRGEQQM